MSDPTDARLQAHAERLRALVPPSAPGLCPQLARTIPWRALGDPAAPGWGDRLVAAVAARVRTHYAALGGLADGDVMAMVFLVLMQAAKSAREDLKAIMDGVKGINAAKQALREQLVLMMERTEGRRPTWPPR